MLFECIKKFEFDRRGVEFCTGQKLVQYTNTVLLTYYYLFFINIILLAHDDDGDYYYYYNTLCINIHNRTSAMP